MATQLDFSTRQLANPSAGIQQNLHDLGAMFGQFQQNKINAEAKAEERAQRAIENKRAEAMLAMQQQQAAQQAEKFGIDKATTAGTQAAQQQLQGATQGLITPEQADVIRQAYEKNKGADVVGMTQKAQKVYEASPLLQRQYVSGVDITQAPTQMQVGIDEMGQPKMMTVQGDPAKAQDLKTQMLRDYDTKIQQDKLFAENQRQFGLKQALDEAQLAETKRGRMVTEKAAREAKEPKVKMYKTEGGMLVEQDVPASMLKQAVDSGFKMGSAKQLRESTQPKTTGTSKIDLLTLGGGSNLFGTSGVDLETLSQRMKAKYKNVPKSSIDAEIANLSQGWVSDSVSLPKLEAILKQY